MSATRESAGFGTFFLPGPTEVRPEILAAMQQPMIPHRGKAFEALYARLQPGLRAMFGTSRPVYVTTSSASGLMEAAVRNAPWGPVLALVNGAFSERFARIAQACGRPVDVLEVPWGGTFDLAQLEARLAAGHESKRFAAVTVVHSETSTGVLTDIAAVARLVGAAGAMCLVDSVTGAGGTEMRTDEWGLDFVLTGSQKALALPPGLAFGVASARFVERAREVPDRGLYFDIVEHEAFARKDQTPSTPALSLLYALDAQLAHIAQEGMAQRWQRHEALCAQTTRWVHDAAKRLGRGGEGMRMLAPEGSRSPTVSAICTPTGISGSAVARAVEQRGYVIGSGYGRLKDLTFRVGHMGDHTAEGLEGCLAACEEALRELLGATKPSTIDDRPAT